MEVRATQRALRVTILTALLWPVAASAQLLDGDSCEVS